MFELKKKVPKISRKSSGLGKNLRLVQRDFELLRFVLEMKSCCSDQIWERFYRGDDVGIKYVQNRLSRLRRGEYLLSHYTHDGPVRYYTGTRKAKEVVMDFFGLDELEIADGRSAIELAQFTHDKGLVWIRIFLENMGVINSWSWDGEITYKHRELAGRKLKDVDLGVVPDGIVEVVKESGDGSFLGAIEFENSLKSRSRRLDKVRNLFMSWDNSEVKWSHKVFIFANKRVEKAYKETFEEFFLERAKKFDFKDMGKPYSRDFDREWERESYLFGKQLLLCATYDELMELYKNRDGVEKLGIRDIFKSDETFMKARNILIEGKKNRILELEKEAINDEKSETMRVEILAEKERKSKGTLGSLFS